MLPENKLSSEVVAAAFLTQLRNSSDVDYEWGGVRLRDTSQGLLKYQWRSQYLGDSLKLYSGAAAPVEVIKSAGITHHSFAFDQNMQPCVVYNKAGTTYYYWYDPIEGKQTTMSFDDYMEYPQVSLDDHRQHQLGVSDIILSYIRDDKLYYRLQRERYLQEHFLEDVPHMKLMQIGMTKNLRFRWRYVRKKQGE